MRFTVVCALVAVGLVAGPSILERVQTLEQGARDAKTSIEVLELRSERLDARVRLLEMEARTKEDSPNWSQLARLSEPEVRNILRDRVSVMLRHQLAKPVVIDLGSLELQWVEGEKASGAWSAVAVGLEEDRLVPVPVRVVFASMPFEFRSERGSLERLEVERVAVDGRVIWERLR